MLGPLERDAVAALQELHEATTRDVLLSVNARGHQVAYTTVSTILSRLHAKGVIERRAETFRGGERYIYVYKDIEDAYIDNLLDGLIRVFGQPGVVRLQEKIAILRNDDLRRVRQDIKV